MEDTIRLGVFFGVFIVMAAAEYFWPRRAQVLKRHKRWPHNLLLVAVDILVLRLALPASLAGFAVIAAQRDWGLLPALHAPFWLTVVISLIVLDLVIYLQHVLFHRVPFLWRLHRVHHTDTEFDVTTALRFHPFEILASMGVKIAVVMLLGIPPEAALLFEALLNACAMFNHGNIHLPVGIDRVLRYVLVTPDMHRVHHSTTPVETNSNYGFSVPVWDRLFGTYRAQPAAGHDDMHIGLDEFRKPEDTRIDKMLKQPFC